MKGISAPVIALLLVLATLFLALGVFVLYSFTFSNVNSSISVQSYLISLSKNIQIQLSTLSYYGLSPSYNYFNVSYLIWVNSPTKYVTLVVFNASPSPLSTIYYELPQSNVKYGLFKSSVSGYIPLESFTLNAKIYVPQNQQLLGTVSVKAYNISSNSTYVFSSIIKPSDNIIIWILYNYEGKWYRLDFTYTNPLSQGLGIYVVSSTGEYSQNSKVLTQAPHYVTTQTADSFGFWFYELNPSTNAIILNLTYVTTSSSSGNNVNVTVLLYQQNGYLYAKILNSKNTQNTIKLLQLYQGVWYFVNITTGSQVNLPQQFNISVFQGGKLLNSAVVSSGTSLNGYNISVKFGSSYSAVAISQAYFVSEKSENGNTQFYNVSSQVMNNGYYYNNTEKLYWIISNAENKLYSVIYWYFTSASSNPSQSVDAVMWYWSSTKLYTVYIPEVGYNTYIII